MHPIMMGVVVVVEDNALTVEIKVISGKAVIGRLAECGVLDIGLYTAGDVTTVHLKTPLEKVYCGYGTKQDANEIETKGTIL
jgi:hypothetical protein